MPEVAEIVGDRLIPLDQVEPLATKQCSRPSCRGRLLAKTVGRLCDTHAALPHCWPYYRYGLAHTPPETKPVWSRPTAEPIDGPPWLTDEDAIVGYIDARLKRADAPSEPSAEPQQFNKTLADAQALGLVTSKQREALELVSTMNHTEGAANLGISREGFTDRLRGAVKSVGKKFPERKNDVKEALERPHIRPAEGRAPTDPLLGFDLEKTIAEFSRLGPDAYRAVMEKCDDEIARAARVHDVKVVEKARRMGATSVIRLDEDNPQSRVQVVEYNTEGDQVGGGAGGPRAIIGAGCIPLCDTRNIGTEKKPRMRRLVWKPAVFKRLALDKPKWETVEKGEPMWVDAGARRLGEQGLPEIVWEGDERNCPLPREWRRPELRRPDPSAIDPDHMAYQFARAARRGVLLEFDRHGKKEKDPPAPKLPDAGIMPVRWLSLQLQWHQQFRLDGPWFPPALRWRATVGN